MQQIYNTAHAAADAQGVDFVPGLTPGYNDTVVRPGNPPAARYLEEQGPIVFGSAMDAMLEDAALPHTDGDVDDLILINSFNEWHEDTQIEATVVTPPTTTDASPSGSQLTQGRSYEGYGNRYLDILRASTTLPGDYNLDSIVDAADFTVWRESLGNVVIPFRSADGNGDGAITTGDYEVWRTNFGQTMPHLWMSVSTVPEPHSYWGMGMAALFGLAHCRKRNTEPKFKIGKRRMGAANRLI